MSHDVKGERNSFPTSSLRYNAYRIVELSKCVIITARKVSGMNERSLLDIGQLSRQDILDILSDAHDFSASKRDWQLPHPGLVANLFFEPSTRTHYSFAAAELGLGLKVEDYTPLTGSTQKGESFRDTCLTFQALGYDLLVIRSPQERYYDEIADLRIPVINAGDGAGSHPTQCLLDLMTIQEEFATFEGLKVAIIGDIAHSRVANSDYQALTSLGARVVCAGPEEFAREGFPFTSVDEAIEGADVVMTLRIQFERLKEGMSITREEYHQRYGLTAARAQSLKPGCIIMHPAPINRGLEIDSELVECPRSRIFKQMENGTYVRKAVIKRAFNLLPFREE